MQGGSLCWDEMKKRTYIHYCEVGGVSKLSPLQFPSCNHRITTTELLIDCSGMSKERELALLLGELVESWRVALTLEGSAS